MNLDVSRLLGYTPAELREELRDGRGSSLLHRRSVIGWSVTGMAAMTAVSLLQTGIIRHLPDPPLPGFNSDKTNLSRSAFIFGVPDGTVSLASLALNIPIAALGTSDRAGALPRVPRLAAGKAAADAAGAAWYLYKMISRQQPWCGYCVVGAVSVFAILAHILREAD